MTPSFLNFMESPLGEWAYVALFAFCFLENLVPFLPGDIIALWSGIQVQAGDLEALPSVLALGFGAWLGFLFFFESTSQFMRQAHSRKFRWFLLGAQKNLSENRIHGLRRYGVWAVLVARFLPGARTTVAIMAGLSRWPHTQVYVAALVSSMLWSILMVLLPGGLAAFYRQIATVTGKPYFWLGLALGGCAVVMLMILRHKKLMSRAPQGPLG